MSYTHEGDEILYVNKDRDKIVPEDSPEAAYVLVGPGGQVPDEDAARLGLLGKRAQRQAQTDDSEADDAETKAVEKEPANKARKPAESK